MNVEIFNLFARMIAALPAQCIVEAVDRQCQMLKNDVENDRFPLPRDAFSIFYFREFVHATKADRTIYGSRPMPPDHIVFFKETIVRLMQANELPQTAMDRFDHAFVKDVDY